MPGPIDLHIHSSFSDGKLSPHQIVERARKLSIKTVALTDHDTTAGLPEFLSQKTPDGPKLIPGIELSAHHHLSSVHILGYGIDHNNHFLKKKLTEIQAAREKRNLSILQKLNSFGFPVSLSQITSAKEGQIGRPHIAHLMVQKGIVKNENEAFRQYLKKDQKAYVERQLLPAEEAISMITRAGGIAALAHPASIDPTCTFLYKLIEDLASQGLRALEVYHPIHNKKHIAFFNRICEELNLLATGGSDFHGRDRDRSEMGHLSRHKFIPEKASAQLEKILMTPPTT